ncbi:N-6 DNA methylase [Helicobacter sp. T3_23-1056]
MPLKKQNLEPKKPKIQHLQNQNTQHINNDSLFSLIKCFEYLKPYYIDALDALCVVLQICLLKIHYKKDYAKLLKTKSLKLDKNSARELFHTLLESKIDFSQNPSQIPATKSPTTKSHATKSNTDSSHPKFIPLDSKASMQKILRFIEQCSISSKNPAFCNAFIERFLDIITQKKTSNKLYFYSTPSEINELLVGILDIKDGEEIYNPCYGIGSVFLSLKNQNIKLYGEELDFKLAFIARLVARISGIKNTHLGISDILVNPLFRINALQNPVQKPAQNPAKNLSQNLTQKYNTQSQKNLKTPQNPKSKQESSDFVKFDKILCNPPLNAQMSTEHLKDDSRFAKTGVLVKSYPELVFLTHSLAHLKQKGVFIVRNQTLLKSALEGKLRSYLCQNGLIEAIIELPKNIFPHQNYDFSVIVISKGNKEILHINTNSEHFYTKDGKYNRLKNIDRILEIYRYKKLTPHSALTPLSKIYPKDLRAQSYINSRLQPLAQNTLSHFSHHNAIKPHLNLAKDFSLQDLGVEIFRGQRVQGTQNDEDIEFYDIGIADFAICGWTQSFGSKKDRGNIAKIHKYHIKPYDILLSLRGISPKIAIVGTQAMHKKEVWQTKSIDTTHADKIPSVVNAGIIVLRAPSAEVAIGLYCYLFSTQGEEILSRLYKTNTDGVIDTQSLLALRVPSDYDKNAAQKMEKLDNAKNKIYAIEWEIQGIKDGK